MGSKIATRSKKKHVVVGPDDLRRAPPVQRLVRQLLAFQAKLNDRRETYEAWSGSLPHDSQVRALMGQGSRHFEALLGAFSPLCVILRALAKTGFSPPRKCFTANTAVGDSVSVLEIYHSSYRDILDPRFMGDLEVIKKYPGKGAGGKGGGLLVKASDGTTLKVASSHVVRLTTT